MTIGKPRGRRPGTPKTGGRRPGTLNRTTREIGELALALVPEAIRELKKLVKSAESESAKVAAIAMVFDRACGKPSQPLRHSGTVGTYDLSRVTDEDLSKLEDILGSIADAPTDTNGEGQTLN